MQIKHKLKTCHSGFSTIDFKYIFIAYLKTSFMSLILFILIPPFFDISIANIWYQFKL